MGQDDSQHLMFSGKRCPRCNYFLTGLPLPRCPECGEIFDPNAPLAGKKKRVRLWAQVASAVLALAAGPTAVCIPVWLHSLRTPKAPLFPTVRTGIEGMSLDTFFYLLVVSAAIGLIASLPGIVTAGLMVLAFPMITLAEVIWHPSSHNLWPLEMILYGLFFPVCLLGTYVGRLTRWGIEKSVEVSRM